MYEILIKPSLVSEVTIESDNFIFQEIVNLDREEISSFLEKHKECKTWNFLMPEVVNNYAEMAFGYWCAAIDILIGEEVNIYERA